MGMMDRSLADVGISLLPLAAWLLFHRNSREVVDPAASYYGHMTMLSSGSMHDLANSTVTVVAGVVPSTGGAAAASRAAPAAHASSMVDPGAAAPVAGTFGERWGTPEVRWLAGCVAFKGALFGMRYTAGARRR